MKERILIVDDSAVVRSLHGYILRSAGYTVEEASNGYEALEKLLTSGSDLVITDLNMPRMDGYAFIRSVRAEEGFQSLPIIIVSTESEIQDKQKGFAAGANVYVVKPTNPTHLVLNVQMLLGK